MKFSTHVIPALGRAVRAGGAAFTAFGQQAAKGLTLVPYYLSGLLWILTQEFIDLARKGYGTNSAVYACIRLLSTSVPEPPLIAYTIDAQGQTQRPLAYDHPLSALIRQPNALMSEYQMWEMITIHLCITGRSVWWKERDNAGRVIALWPLRPDRVGPIYSVANDPTQQVIAGWSYLVPGTTHYVPIARDDTALFLIPDPAGESGGLVEGLGPLQVLASEVGADNQATQFVGALLDNYAAPGVILSTKSPLKSTEDAKLIKESFKREFAGNRAGSAAVIDADTTITQVGFSLQQLEFPALRRVAESRIAAAVGVPAVLVGLQVGLESGIRATIAEQREHFAETTLASHWRRDSDAFTRDVASEFGPRIVCRFDTTVVKALQVQANNEIEKIAKGFSQGAVTLDEYRQHVLNLPPLDQGGEVRLVPASVSEVGPEGQLAQQQQMLEAQTEQQKQLTQAKQQSGDVSGTNAQPNEGEPVPAGKTTNTSNADEPNAT